MPTRLEMLEQQFLLMGSEYEQVNKAPEPKNTEIWRFHISAESVYQERIDWFLTQ